MPIDGIQGGGRSAALQHAGRWGLVGVVTILVALTGVLPAQGSEPEPATSEPAAAVESDAAPETAPAVVSPGDYYGCWVLIPPLLTIVLAIIWRQVIPALVMGILVAGYMLAYVAATQPLGGVAVGGLTIAVEDLLIVAICDVDHVKIIVFTLLIGGMVGIIAANGGTPAIVHGVARWASSRRRGQIATWLAGLLVFFDDYANAMLVGPSMRPVCDRLGISRAKLAYLVDSTAAPVASIALIGTWIGAEIGFIHEGLRDLAEVPSFLQGATLDRGLAYDAFLHSIPYRFYPILALVMVFLVGLLDRDFGPMRKAESDALQAGSGGDATSSGDAVTRGRAWYAGVPILVLVVVTLSLLVVTGWLGVQATGGAAEGFSLVQQIVTSGNSYDSILYGALAAVAVATVISLGTRALTLAKTMDSAVAAMSRMLPTFIVLVLAWTLSAAMRSLQLGEVAEGMLQRVHFSVRWLPVLIFAASCIVSFATGTSWGTMGILCPAAVTVSAGLLNGVATDEALPIFYASIGAVLAGAVFGDHCSPISDTTVLSSLASECTLERHVWTQMPYALTVAAVSVICGDLLGRGLGVPAWAGLIIGCALLVGILLVVGRRPRGHPVRDAGQRTA